MGHWDAIQMGRAQILEIITKLEGPEAAARKALEFIQSDEAAQNAKTLIQAQIRTFRSAPPPPVPDTVLPYAGARAPMMMRPDPQKLQAVLQAVRTTANNPTVQTNAMRTGAGTTVTAGATIGLWAFLKLPVSQAFAVAPASTVGAIGAAFAVGYGLGTLIDQSAGWIRDDGRTLSASLAAICDGDTSKLAEDPQPNERGQFTNGWRVYP